MLRGPAHDEPPRLDDVLTLPDVSPVLERDELPLFGGARARRLRRLRRVGVCVSIGLAVVLVAGGAFVVTQRNVTTTVSLSEAVERFRDADTDAVSSRSAPAARASRHAVNDGGPVALGPVAEGPEQAIVASEPYVPPAPGVYVYRTQGGEQVSMFNAKHTYPERTFSTIRHLGGCRWEQRNEVIEEHVDTRHLCSDKGSVAQLMQERAITFFGKEEGAAMTCDDPTVLHATGESPGSRSVGACSGTDGTEYVLTRTFVDAERVVVDGEAIDAMHVRIDADMTGRATGSSTDDLWLHPDTGLTLRWQRTVDTMAKAFGANVRYTEDASFVLESLEPQR